MRRFPVDRHAEGGALSFNFRIEKRQLTVFFNLHSELNCAILQVEVVQSCFQCVTPHDSESDTDEAKPRSWTIGHGGDAVGPQVLHEDIGYNRRDGRSHGQTVRHLVELFAELLFLLTRFKFREEFYQMTDGLAHLNMTIFPKPTQ